MGKPDNFENMNDDDNEIEEDDGNEHANREKGWK